MDNWKVNLDKYLTSGPLDDRFDGWCENTLDKLSDEFYNTNEKWINDCSGQCNTWLNELFDADKDSTEAAQLLEFLFKFI